MSDVAPTLKTVEGEDRKPASELLPLVYEELRKLAAHKLASEAPGHTLQATALVHEAWLRLIRVEGQEFENRGHFFAAAAEAMRRILIERARRKSAQRHGGGLERVDLDQIDVPEKANDELLLRIDAALEGLTREDARAAHNQRNERKSMKNQFDELTKSLAQSVTRRAALKKYCKVSPVLLL